jgi:hypothetical protein
MPPFVPAPNCARIDIRFSQNGALTENVWNVELASAPTSTDLIAIADVVDGVVKASWLPQMHSSIRFIETVVTDISVEGGAQLVKSAGAAQNGLMGGLRMPNEVSLAIRLKASSGGRNGSGRLFWQGLADGQVENVNFVKPTSADAIVEAVQELIDALELIGAIVSIISRFLNKVPRGTAVAFGPVSPSLFDATLDSQRRRKPGNGS